MKLNKSTTTLLLAILILVLGMIVTTQIVSHNKWLYYRISVMDDSNKLTERRWLNLDGIWYVKSEDSIAFANTNIKDNDWSTDRYLYIALLKVVKKNTWLRKHFVCPNQISSEKLLLRLSLFDTQAQVYLNGKKIADSCFLYNASVCCYIPTNYLIKGKENVIALRSPSMLPNMENGLIKFNDEILSILEPTIHLEGTWKFATGDDVSWKNKICSDSTFKSLYVPQFWDDQGYKDYDGIAWYRKTFVAKDDMRNKQLVFFAGKIDDFGEIYINGHKIGGQIIKTKDIRVTEWDTNCLYPFNGDILEDSNTVAIRVMDNQLRGGIHQGPIGIMKMDDYLKFIEKK